MRIPTAQRVTETSNHEANADIAHARVSRGLVVLELMSNVDIAKGQLNHETVVVVDQAAH